MTAQAQIAELPEGFEPVQPQGALPDGFQPVAQPANALPEGFEPVPAAELHPITENPPAFSQRVAQGTQLAESFQKMAAEPYSQRLKEWTAQHLKAGDYGMTALGTAAATVAGILEAPFDFAGYVHKAMTHGLTPQEEVAAGFTGAGVAMGLGEPSIPKGTSPLFDAGNGQLARVVATPEGPRTQVVGTYPPTHVDFDNAAASVRQSQEQMSSLEGKFVHRRLEQRTQNPMAAQGVAAQEGSGTMFPPANDEAGLHARVQAKLHQMWEEQGLHPAEVADDAKNDAFLAHDLGAPEKRVELDPLETEVLAETGGKPGALSAAASDPPTDIPLSRQPASPPGRLVASIRQVGDRLYDMGRDARMLVAPMATGTRESMALAKDFANAMRRNRWEWTRVDDDIVKRFDSEQRERMWNAADEESVLRQEGQSSEHMGLATLTPEERAAVEDAQQRAQAAWLRAVDLGMVEGEGLPSYTPRMVVNVAHSVGDGPRPLNTIGGNLRTRTPQMLHRKYLTAEESEAAAKAAFGEGAEIVRDIRTLPLATSRLEDAIAGRTLIDNIKQIGRRTGSETVAEGFEPKDSEFNWFTLDHPAFKTWRPKLERGADGLPVIEGNHLKIAKDENGNELFERVPLYVRGDFEGPLRAVLSEPRRASWTPQGVRSTAGAIYGGLMSLKAKTMSLIMNSPLIHNAVEWGRAMEAKPGKVVTFKIYFEGNRVKNDPMQMREAIDNGLVPIGKRFFNQDLTSIAEAPDLTPGRSLTSKVLAFVPGLFDDAAGVAVKRAIDKAGDFWHNTLLWDRVGDLQMGLYSNFRDDLLAKGIDRVTAARIAAHFANRFAGSLPEEAMSRGARALANLAMFSRTYTLGNWGVMKDAITGLPRDVMAQIERDAGPVDPNAAGYAKALARRKAISAIAFSVALTEIGNSLLQNAANIMFHDSTLEKEYHEYVQRLLDAFHKLREHPLALLQPLDFIHSLSATSENEPSKRDRIYIGMSGDGQGIYMRSPVGKTGEELEGYMSGPLDMMRRKLSPLARTGVDLFANDRGFGRKLYDPTADDIAGYFQNALQIGKHIVELHMPAGQLYAFSNLVKGVGDPKVNAAQAFGPFVGATFSRGAPGGRGMGQYYYDKAKQDFRFGLEWPDIRRQIQSGDYIGARNRLMELDVPSGEIKALIANVRDPSRRLNSHTVRQFYQGATPEQRMRFEQLRGR